MELTRASLRRQNSTADKLYVKVFKKKKFESEYWERRLFLGMKLIAEEKGKNK